MIMSRKNPFPFLFLIALLGALCALPSCTRTSNDVWEDTKSAGRHVQRGIRALAGYPADSRQIHSRNEFECVEDNNFDDPFSPFQDFQDFEDPQSNPSNPYSQDPDFIPLADPTHELSTNEVITRPPRETPGETGSSIPGIEAFRDPSTIPQLAAIFRPLYFDYDSSLVKGAQNLQTIHMIADFLRYHPNVYLFIEGHTDERGPQAYNLALGSRRSNAVRNLLISEGINPDHLFTISYGKERPVILERHEEGWAKNRRAEFKVYER